MDDGTEALRKEMAGTAAERYVRRERKKIWRESEKIWREIFYCTEY